VSGETLATTALTTREDHKEEPMGDYVRTRALNLLDYMRANGIDPRLYSDRELLKKVRGLGVQSLAIVRQLTSAKACRSALTADTLAPQLFAAYMKARFGKKTSIGFECDDGKRWVAGIRDHRIAAPTALLMPYFHGLAEVMAAGHWAALPCS